MSLTLLFSMVLSGVPFSFELHSDHDSHLSAKEIVVSSVKQIDNKAQSAELISLAESSDCTHHQDCANCECSHRCCPVSNIGTKNIFEAVIIESDFTSFLVQPIVSDFSTKLIRPPISA